MSSSIPHPTLHTPNTAQDLLHCVEGLTQRLAADPQAFRCNSSEAPWAILARFCVHMLVLGLENDNALPRDCLGVWSRQFFQCLRQVWWGLVAVVVLGAAVFSFGLVQTVPQGVSGDGVYAAGIHHCRSLSDGGLACVYCSCLATSGFI